MHLIAIVGKSGSGKTYFSELLTKYFSNSFNKTVLHVDMDKIGHKVIQDSEVITTLKTLLGEIIINENGTISRKKLSNLVFSNKNDLEILHNTTLPKMKEIINDLILSNLDKDYIILDYALLPLISPYFEACHYKILIESDIEKRKKRILTRDKITVEKFYDREKASLTYNSKNFDILIDNCYDSNINFISNIENDAYATCFHLINLSKKQKIAYYPGSFDPITYGHIDIINKTLNIGFDKIIVAVTANSSKKFTMFTLEERAKMIREFFGYNPKIKVITVDSGKASVKVAEKYCSSVMIRGLRNVTDFEYELDLSKVNSSISTVETLFLTASHKYDFVSSSITRELAYLNEDISSYVPPIIEKYVKEKIC